MLLILDNVSCCRGGNMDCSEVTDLAGIKSVTISTLQDKLSEGAFADA